MFRISRFKCFSTLVKIQMSYRVLVYIYQSFRRGTRYEYPCPCQSGVQRYATAAAAAVAGSSLSCAAQKQVKAMIGRRRRVYA